MRAIDFTKPHDCNWNVYLQVNYARLDISRLAKLKKDHFEAIFLRLSSAHLKEVQIESILITFNRFDMTLKAHKSAKHLKLLMA